MHQMLQDNVLPFSHFVAKQIIREDFSRVLNATALDEILNSMSNESTASASLGQVYKALYNGKAVAIKVLRPTSLETVASDFLILRTLGQLIQQTGFIRSNIVDAIDELGSRIYEEVNYVQEAQNLEDFFGLYGAYPGLQIPRIERDLCSKRVITMSWIDGEKFIRNNSIVLKEGVYFVFCQSFCVCSKFCIAKPSLLSITHHTFSQSYLSCSLLLKPINSQ